jgi:hypothetical protein
MPPVRVFERLRLSRLSKGRADDMLREGSLVLIDALIVESAGAHI